LSENTLTRLCAAIHARRNATADASYTRSLLDKGVAACAKKFGEEAVEAVIAAMGESDARLKAEAADVIYHLLVVLEARNLPFSAVLLELESRMQQSGHQEKAARQNSEPAS
jgi:phosphoribosyl-ATP pyrophosphohydrolase